MVRPFAFSEPVSPPSSRIVLRVKKIQAPAGRFRLSREKAVVLAYVDAFNRGDLDVLCNLFTPDAQIWGVLGWGAVEKARPVWKALIESMKMQLHVDAIISEGHTVAVRYTECGQSNGEFMGKAPTGRSYEITAMEWFEIKDGLIHRRWGTRDSAAISRQLGFAE
jgi:ketosteroid isomerase-like protein